MIDLEELTAEHVQGSRAVMATDGHLGRVVWGSIDPERGGLGPVLYVQVAELDASTVDRVRLRLAALGFGLLVPSMG